MVFPQPCTTSANIWEDKKKDMVDFRAGCYEKGQDARHVRQGVAPLKNSQAGALRMIPQKSEWLGSLCLSLSPLPLKRSNVSL